MENKYKSTESLIEDAIKDLKRTRSNRISKSERFKSYTSKWNTLFFVTNIGTIIAILITYTKIEASDLSIFITNSFSIYLILLQYFLSTLDYSARSLKLHYEQLEINELRMQLKLLLVSESPDKASEFRHLFEKYSISLKNNENHDAYDVKTAIDTFMSRFENVCDSITCDRGTEFTSSLFIYSIEDTYGKKLYYADPQSPGQRGTNERMNRELRRVFPAGYDFTKITQRKLQNAIQDINERPRNVLRFKTPEKVFTKRIMAA